MRTYGISIKRRAKEHIVTTIGYLVAGRLRNATTNGATSLGTGSLKWIIAHRGKQLHALIVNRIALKDLPKEIVRVAEAIVGFVYRGIANRRRAFNTG